MAQERSVPVFSYLLGFNIIASIIVLTIGIIILIKSQSSEFVNSQNIYSILMTVGIICLVVALVLGWNAIDILFLTTDAPECSSCLGEYKNLVENDMVYCYKGQVTNTDTPTTA